MNVLTTKQQDWCSQFYVKDGVKWFDHWQKNKVVRLSEETHKMVEESQRSSR